jgi:hypothetical protein
VVDWVSEPLTVEEWGAERDRLPGLLAENRERRDRATDELRASRDELQTLLARGQNVAVDVAVLARHAGISRDTAHRLLRKAGSVSFRERHRRAEAAGIPQGEARGRWFREQGFGAVAADEQRDE